MIYVRVPAAIKAAITEYAAQHGHTIATAVALLVERGLSSQDSETPTLKPAHTRRLRARIKTPAATVELDGWTPGVPPDEVYAIAAVLSLLWRQAAAETPPASLGAGTGFIGELSDQT